LPGERVTSQRAAVGLALEPESSRWRLQEALRLSVRRTCTPAPTCNPRGCAYRLRDIPDWRTPQEVAPSIPQWRTSGAACDEQAGMRVLRGPSRRPVPGRLDRADHAPADGLSWRPGPGAAACAAGR